MKDETSTLGKILGSCAPQEGEPYKCVNCTRFDFEKDGCFTKWMEQYGLKEQPNVCPGYQPPEKGEFILMVTGELGL